MLAEKSHIRGYFEPTLYRKRHKVQVRCVELTAMISIQGPESGDRGAGRPQQGNPWVPEQRIRHRPQEPRRSAGSPPAHSPPLSNVGTRSPWHRTRSGRRRKATFAQGLSDYLIADCPARLSSNPVASLADARSGRLPHWSGQERSRWASSPREVTPVLVNTLRRWNATVRGDTQH